MSEGPRGTEEQAPVPPEARRAGGDAERGMPIWLLGLIPLVAAGVMLVLALHV